MITTAVTTLNRHREKVSLVGYFVVMLGLTLPLATMLGSAYEEGKLTRSLIDLHLLVDVIDLEGVSVFFLGLFVGLLVLLTIDPKKRWQAYLLWIGLVISLLGLRTIGLFIPNIQFTSTTNLSWLAAGLVLGLVLGGGRKLLRTQTAQALEFRRAAKGIYLFVVLLIVGSLLETHLVYPNFLQVSSDGVAVVFENSGVSFDTDGIVRNTVLSGIFVVTVKRFMQYDAEEEFFVLGPRGSGKSLFLIGAYLEALNRGRNDEATKQTPLQPSQELMEMVESLDQRTQGWLIEATGRGEIKNLEFQYVHGSTFPKNVNVSSVDYAGEYLNRLPDALSGAVADEETDNTLLRLAEGVEDADTLILLIDLERFVADDESLDISEYFSILQAADDKGVFVVATKADVFVDDFQREQGIEPHLAFDEFKDYVNQRLRQSEQVDSLIRQTAGAEIHPVYYQTTENENGDLVPMRDESGSVMTIGFDQLLDELGR